MYILQLDRDDVKSRDLTNPCIYIKLWHSFEKTYAMLSTKHGGQAGVNGRIRGTILVVNPPNSRLHPSVGLHLASVTSMGYIGVMSTGQLPGMCLQPRYNVLSMCHNSQEDTEYPAQAHKIINILRCFAGCETEKKSHFPTGGSVFLE